MQMPYGKSFRAEQFPFCRRNDASESRKKASLHDAPGYETFYTYLLKARIMENNKYRNTNDIDDTEYRRMRKSEDSSYEYHEADAEDIDEANVDDGYPEAVEHDESGSVYDLKTDFIVLLPGEIIRIPQDSNLAWMTEAHRGGRFSGTGMGLLCLGHLASNPGAGR